MEGEPNQPQSEVFGREKKVIQPLENSQQQTPVHHTVMREEPYDWNAYHSAWQQYYHQYFYRYYATWWQQQRSQVEAQAAPAVTEEALSANKQASKELRDKIRSTVTVRAKKVKSSSHFRPILAAVTVGAAFLLINYNQVLVGAIKQYVAPGNVATTPVIVAPNTQDSVGSEAKVVIPKIGVEAPVVYDEPRVDNTSYENALERGVVRLGNTADPGTKGNIVIGGHSSNNVFNPGKYKYVFVNLKRLDVNDIIYLNYNGKRYTYKVTVAKKVIPPTDTSALGSTDVPTLTLFTCDPPGTNINRLIVQAVQIDPDPNGAGSNTNQQTTPNKANPLPSVAPSIWDKLF
jgi:sortase A